MNDQKYIDNLHERAIKLMQAFFGMYSEYFSEDYLLKFKELDIFMKWNVLSILARITKSNEIFCTAREICFGMTNPTYEYNQINDALDSALKFLRKETCNLIMKKH